MCIPNYLYIRCQANYYIVFTVCGGLGLLDNTDCFFQTTLYSHQSL